MELIGRINQIIAILFCVCYSYQFVYIPIGLFYRKKDLTEKIVHHNYAVLICARNEEEVIADLIESIKRQTYPKGLVDTFVLADNCSDNTAMIASKCGAIVYTRESKAKVGKGYALHALLENIKRDFSKGYDGYIVFDADNVLKQDYIERLNETFCQGYQIITTYRNSKNYEDNWISAGYGLWFIRECKFLNNVRSAINQSACVGGTGFMFSKKVLDEMEGWPYHLLTEDIEFSIDHIIKGYKIGFCEKAEFYDEQPTKLKQSIDQRLRWAKGYLEVLRDYGISLLKGMLRGSYSCFDMTMTIMPAFILSLASIVCNCVLTILTIASSGMHLSAFYPVLRCFGQMYLVLFVVGVITTITEWKHIDASAIKKLAYSFTFPLFMMTYMPISFMALFVKVSWKPIAHSVRDRRQNKIQLERCI